MQAMKRTDLVAGEQYVTSTGVVFEIEATDPGWRTEASGEWVHEPATGKRYTLNRETGEREYAEYQTNGAVRAWRIDHTKPGERTKVAIEPRILVSTRKEYQGTYKDAAANVKEWGKATKALARAAKAKGLPAPAVDIRTRTAVLSVDALAKALGVEVPA